MKITQFLKDNNVRYWTSGNNVSKGWINITCIFCNDSTNHLGIRLKDLKVSCWKCGKHYIGTLVSRIANVSFKEAKVIVKSLEGGSDSASSENKNTNPFIRPAHVTLPPEASKDFPKLHLNYLRKRGFNARKIIKKYDLYACYTFGKFKFRIVIPIYQNKRLVAYTSRDVTGQSKLRYLTAKDKDCIINPSEIIYNFDSILPYQDAINVEGPPDVWKMGDGSFSFTGITLTEKRMLEIAEKKIQTLYLLYDNEPHAQTRAKRNAKILAPLVKNVEIIKLRNHNDPAELKYTEVEEVKRLIGFNYKS